MTLRVLLLLLFVFIVNLFEKTALTAWGSSLELLPVSFLFGVLTLHFVSNSFGVLWLVLSGFGLHLLGLADAPYRLSYALAALVMWVFARRVFTNRSVYAMMGLGTVGFLVVSLVHLVWFSLRGTGEQALQSLLTEWTLFLTALFISFFLSRRLSTFMRTIFFVRQG